MRKYIEDEKLVNLIFFSIGVQLNEPEMKREIKGLHTSYWNAWLITQYIGTNSITKIQLGDERRSMLVSSLVTETIEYLNGFVNI